MEFPLPAALTSLAPGKRMPPASKAGSKVTTSRGEVLRFKSPAEFVSTHLCSRRVAVLGARPHSRAPARNEKAPYVDFRGSPARHAIAFQFSENKNIAGFDNVGKSLYTTVRELVENALDACESIRQLPDIEITLEEFDTAALNRLIGVAATERLDAALYERVKTASRKKAPDRPTSSTEDVDGPPSTQATGAHTRWPVAARVGDRDGRRTAARPHPRRACGASGLRPARSGGGRANLTQYPHPERIPFFFFMASAHLEALPADPECLSFVPVHVATARPHACSTHRWRVQGRAE